VPVDELLPIDRWVLARLAAWNEKVTKAYEEYEFHVAYHATIQFCAVELSAPYFDIIKDRLYTWKKWGKARRSALTVLQAVAEDLVRLVAPVLSFTASEAWSYLPVRSADSVFLAGLPKRARPADADALEAHYAKLFEVRAAVQAKLEEARKAKLIGSGLEAKVTVRAEGDTHRLLAQARDELPSLFIVSGVELAQGPLEVLVERAPGVKCERCWIYRDDVGADANHPTVCAKCADALT
jgi:isoleucyl-tRNA synthetase